MAPDAKAPEVDPAVPVAVPAGTTALVVTISDGEAALVAGVSDHALVVTTGGTGLTPRDVTPQATLAVIDYEVPGLAEAIRAFGRAHTPMADLSRGVVGVRNQALIVNVP